MTRVAKAFVYDDKGRLLVLRRSGTHPRHAYEPDLPGGIIENGESYEEGLAREILEETGLTVEPGNLAYVAKTRRYSINEWRLYEISLATTPAVKISWEHDRYAWLDPTGANLDGSDTFMDFAREHADHATRTDAP